MSKSIDAKKRKSTNREIIDRAQDQGAFFILFDQEKLAGTKEQKDILLGLQKFGFFITEDACLIPTQLDRKDIPHCRAALGEKIAPPNEGARDEWPRGLQSSSLCHCHYCLNPAHSVREETWCNRKRNYCRGWCTVTVGATSCALHDCGMEPPCLMAYRSIKELEDAHALPRGNWSTMQDELQEDFSGSIARIGNDGAEVLGLTDELVQREKKSHKRAPQKTDPKKGELWKYREYRVDFNKEDPDIVWDDGKEIFFRCPSCKKEVRGNGFVTHLTRTKGLDHLKYIK